MTADFSIDLAGDARGLVWAYWQIFNQRLSGILSIHSYSSNKSELKKEIAFVRGEALGIRSNWQQDSLRYFITHQNLKDLKALVELWAELPSQTKNDEFIQQALSRQILSGVEIQELLAAYFQDRLFNQLTLRRGKLEWKLIPNLTEDTVSPEIVRLSKPFDKALWEEILGRFEESYCRSRFSKQASQSFLVRQDFPLPLSAQELRLWNQLKGKTLHFSGLEGLSLKMLTAALEFGLMEWGEPPVKKWEKDLHELQRRFQGASPFEILEISEDASLAEAKTKYLEYVKKFHPDRLPADLPDSLRALSELILSQINEAFSVISDPEKRQEMLAERELKAQGGVEAIEKKIKAELAFEEARMALKRRHFARGLELLDSVMGYLGEDFEYQVERSFAILMRDAEAKKLDPSKFGSFHKIFDQAIQLRPDYANAFYYKGLLLKFENNGEEALAYFDQAVHLDSSLQEAASEARLIRMRKEKDKSKSWFRKKS